MGEQIPVTLQDLPVLLEFISASDRDTWVQVGMGIKAEFGGDGWDAWNTWSQSDKDYKSSDAESVWKSFRKSGTGFGTVLKLALDNGWTPEKTELSAEDKRRFAREQDARRKARQAEVEADEALLMRMRALVAACCSEIVADHLTDTGTSPYLEKKQCPALGVGFMRHTVVFEIDDQAERCQLWVGEDAADYLKNVPKPRPAHLSMMVLKRGDLIIPLRDASGQIHSLQHINSTGTKLFPKYGRKSGCFHVLSNIADCELIGLAEGYATAASCQLATGWAMAVGVDSGNLPKVAAALRELRPDARIVVCGDDDPNAPGNPGRTKAEVAAKEVDGVAIFPVCDSGTDWNDLHVAMGLEVVSDQLLAGLEQADAHAALPPTPSGDAAPAGAATSEGGGESGEAGVRVFQRYALIEGTTKVFDLYKRVAIKRTAFEMLVTKPVAKAWADREDKKCIAEDQAQRLIDQAKLAGKTKGKTDAPNQSPVVRYVYIDGTQDIWDSQKRRRIPVAALRVALGDAYSLWLNSSERREVDQEHLVFDPTMSLDPAVYINTFEGLPLTPGEDFTKCQAIIEMLDFLCNGDADARHWLTCWLALPLQRVGTKMATAVLMHSTMEGSGKSLLLSDIMRPIYGPYGATVGQTQLESQWSAWQSSKLYGVFEEVVSRDQRYNQVGKIKHMITGKTMRIESKFISGWEEANYMNATFLSNEIIPWPIAPDDRRLLVVWPDWTLQGELLDRVIAEKDSGGIEAFYGYLLQYDLGSFDAHTRPPKTPARQRLVELSMASWQTFLSEWRLGYLGDLWHPCVSSDLYALFAEWCGRNKEHSLSHTKFSGFIATQVPKAKGVPWYDGKRRAFAAFFFPEEGVEASPPPSLDAFGLAKQVDTWRVAARSAGWKVDEWDHMKRDAA